MTQHNPNPTLLAPNPQVLLLLQRQQCNNHVHQPQRMPHCCLKTKADAEAPLPKRSQHKFDYVMNWAELIISVT
jgi:hypothetical protein